ncbi:hypothetical protein PPL_09759 [Heterostelium album PN500]|uniref:Uncharacterized protein n=1 Tax=Heterostelium pallidum (strain ATCC 26659 / Pp 5 / PN500) TaxID=670386 RepID=D3BNZ7_HETP5|nr:hypothetical protein PPL_09759 [Heterostelium album PN500]EFA77007.1 hypothetical protein PPL_09759 [Heterostelium album PN500]|eukprot:XP_020429137.1 hypothetical protein PPL_09759 [Heterostelium album PN500]
MFKEIITFGFLGVSMSQLIFDVAVLFGLNYQGYPVPEEDPSLQRLRSRFRVSAALCIPLSAVVGFTIAYGWTKLLMKVNKTNILLFGLLTTIHAFQLIKPFLSYGYNMKSIYKYYRTGVSKYNSGIIDELVSNSNSAVFHEARLHTFFDCTCAAIPIYLLAYFLSN